MGSIKKQQIVIIQTPNFDDELLTILSESLPITLVQLTLDFTGCQSLKGSGFLQLFEKISQMDNLKKLHLDFSEVYDINDFVIQGLSMLIESLDLQEFYLDLYEVDQITQEGYLLLAQSISHLQNLKRAHIDLSANPELTQDALQLMFQYLPRGLRSLGFRILDIQHIGGGSFYKLSDSIIKMEGLEQINLTISTFSNLNQKSIYSLIKAMNSKRLKRMNINFSNINLAEKILSYFIFAQNLENISFDFSCNPSITDRDIVSFCSKIPVDNCLKSATFNFDFCKVSQQAIETLIERLCENSSFMKLTLPDRKYSVTFINNVIRLIQQGRCSKSFIMFNCHAVGQMEKMIGLERLLIYKEKEKLKRNILFASYLINKNKNLGLVKNEILKSFLE